MEVSNMFKKRKKKTAFYMNEHLFFGQHFVSKKKITVINTEIKKSYSFETQDVNINNVL